MGWISLSWSADLFWGNYADQFGIDFYGLYVNYCKMAARFSEAEIFKVIISGI